MHECESLRFASEVDGWMGTESRSLNAMRRDEKVPNLDHAMALNQSPPFDTLRILRSRP